MRIGPVIIFFVLQLSACESIIQDKPGAAKIPRDWRWAGQQQQYNLLAEMALASKQIDLQNQMPSDIDSYCLGYEKLSRSQRLTFWGDFLAAISYHESRHNTELKYQENFNDSSGSRVISRGLLQLSFESSKGYGCPLETAAQLHDPAKNIACGVRILHKWVIDDGVISNNAGWFKSRWKGAARYWSVLRRPQTRSAIQAQMQGQDYCNI